MSAVPHRPPAPSLAAERLQTFYGAIFQEMESLIERYQSFGNWAVGGIPHLEPVPTQKELGLWYAKGHIPGFAEPGAVSIALVPGDTRLGLFLPESALHSKDGSAWLEESLAVSYDGQRPQTTVHDPSRVLFDRYFRDPPFDAQSLSRAMETPYGADAHILVQRLAYMVVSLWSQAIRILYAEGKVRSERYLVQCGVPLSADDLKGLPEGMFVQTHNIGKDNEPWFASYIRTSATQERILEHLRALGIAGSITVEPFSEVTS
jgi:hypothetical protein